MKEIPKSYLITGAVVLALALLVTIFVIGRKLGKGNRSKQAKLPNSGSGIPEGWTPTASARNLYNAMDGMGTDTTAIWTTLEDKTEDQLVAIYNEFNRLYESEGDGNLFDWFNDDLSGSDLSRALNYYQGLI